MSKHLLFTESILEKPAGAVMATKAKRAYDTAVTKTTDGDNKTKDGALPYQGKTLLIEKKDKGYEFRIEGGAVLDKEIPELIAEFMGDGPGKPKRTFVPPGPVAVNETWKIDPKDIFGDFAKDPNSKVLNSQGISKLVKVYNKDGRLYGVIETLIGIDVKMTMPVPPGGDVQMKIAAKIDFDGCIDGTFAAGQMSGRVEMQSAAAMKVPDVGAVSSVSNMTSTIEQAWLESPKK